MYLVDTNIFLELLLEQEKADEVRKFFLLWIRQIYRLLICLFIL